MEKCIICNKQLKIKKTEDIQRRKYYIQGAGQLCETCYNKLYKEER
jgi:hypothetical protein